MHAPHPGHPTTLAPAFAPRRGSHAGDEDVGVHGIMHHASGSGLILWHGGQIGEIMAAALAYAARGRAT
jgi:hypothetical protein